MLKMAYFRAYWALFCIKVALVTDPACGSGGFLIESLRHVWTQVKVEGEELGWPEREIFADQQEVAIKKLPWY